MCINAFVHVCAKDEAHGTPASMSTNNSLLSRNSTKQTRGTVEEQEVRVVLHCIRGVNVTIKNSNFNGVWTSGVTLGKELNVKCSN
jgi:hypothetical protein